MPQKPKTKAPPKEPVQLPSWSNEIPRAEATSAGGLLSPRSFFRAEAARIPQKRAENLHAAEMKALQPGQPVPPEYDVSVNSAARAMSTNGGTRNLNSGNLELQIQKYRQLRARMSIEEHENLIRAAKDQTWTPTGEEQFDAAVIFAKRLNADSKARGWAHLSSNEHPAGWPEPQDKYGVFYIGPIDADVPAQTKFTFPTVDQAQRFAELLGPDWQYVPPTSREYHIPEYRPGADPIRFSDADSDWTSPRLEGLAETAPDWIERSLRQYHSAFEQKYLRDSAPAMEDVTIKLNQAEAEALAADKPKVAAELTHMNVEMRRQLQGLSGVSQAEIVAETAINTSLNGSADLLSAAMQPIMPGFVVPHVFIINPIGQLLTMLRVLNHRLALSGPSSIWNRKLEGFVQFVPYTGMGNYDKLIEMQTTSAGRLNRALQTDVVGLALGSEFSTDPRQPGGQRSFLLAGQRFMQASSMTDATQAIGYWRWEQGERPNFIVKVEPGATRDQFIERMSEFRSRHEQRLRESDATGTNLAEVEIKDAERIFGSNNVDGQVPLPGRNKAENSPEWLYSRQLEGYVAVGGDWEANTFYYLNMTMFPHFPGYNIPFLQAHPMYSKVVPYREPMWRQHENVLDMAKEFSGGNTGPMRRYVTFRLAHNGAMPILRAANVVAHVGDPLRNDPHEDKNATDMARWLESLPEPVRLWAIGGLFGIIHADTSRQMDASTWLPGQSDYLLGQRIEPDDPAWMRVLAWGENFGFGSDVLSTGAGALSSLTLDERIPEEDRLRRRTIKSVGSSAAGRAALNVVGTFAPNTTRVGDEPIGRTGLTTSERLSKLGDDGNSYIPITETQRLDWIKDIKNAPIEADAKKAITAALAEAKDTGRISVEVMKPALGGYGPGAFIVGGNIESTYANSMLYGKQAENRRIESHLSKVALNYAAEIRKESGGKPTEVKKYDPDLQERLSVAMNEYYQTHKVAAVEFPSRVTGSVGGLRVSGNTDQKNRLAFFHKQVNYGLNIKVFSEEWEEPRAK